MPVQLIQEPGGRQASPWPTPSTISDLIVGQGNQIEGIILALGGFLGIGEKKIGVRMGALKISTAEGKASITLANATKEVLSAVPAYQQALPGKK